MSHGRQQIRDAVVAAVTGLATTGNNVFRTRIHPLEEASLPALLVYTLSETSDIDTMGRPRGQSRVLRIGIEIAVQQLANIDNLMDTIAAEVEVAMASNAPLNGMLHDLTLDSADVVKSGDGEVRMLGMQMTYSAQYRTREGSPATLL